MWQHKTSRVFDTLFEKLMCLLQSVFVGFGVLRQSFSVALAFLELTL